MVIFRIGCASDCIIIGGHVDHRFAPFLRMRCRTRSVLGSVLLVFKAVAWPSMLAMATKVITERTIADWMV